MKNLFLRLGESLALSLAIIIVVVALGWTQETTSQAPATSAPSNPGVRKNLSSADLAPKVAEDFSTPALTKDTVLGGIEGLELESDENPQFTREVVRVMWRPGDPIDLYVIKPAGISNPPVIVYLFDYPTENDHYRNADFCRLLTKSGFAAVGFVPALTGQRYHDRPMKEWFVSNLKESLAATAHDVQMVLNYLAKRGDVDMNRIGMFGDGSGASIAVLAAAVDPRIKTLDLLDPWGDWPDWVRESKRVPENERPAYLKPDWLIGVAPLDPVKWLPKLKSQKVRIQFVRDIAVTPADVQQKIEAAVPGNAQVVHYDNTAAFRSAISGGTGFDWIKQKMEFRLVADYSAAGLSQSKGASDRPSDSRQ